MTDSATVLMLLFSPVRLVSGTVDSLGLVGAWLGRLTGSFRQCCGTEEVETKRS